MRAGWILTTLVLVGQGTRAEDLELHSPDGAVRAQIMLSDEGTLRYRVDYQNQPVVLPSRLGLMGAHGVDLTRGFGLQEVTRLSVRASWRPPAGERSTVTDAYEGLTALFENRTQDGFELSLECRAYDAGFAFRYRLARPGINALQIEREETEFVFNADHRAWPVYSAQGEYKPALLSQLQPGAERPLTLEIDGGPVVALGEAGCVAFARMKFQPLAGTPHALAAKLDGPATLALPGATPWRFVMVAPTPARLLEQNDLVLNLNEPSRIADTSWIKPGKVIREVSLTTAGGKACVDFCTRMNMQFVEFDAGWYGHEYDELSDARTVTVDPKRSPGPLDLRAVIRYARERGVGVILYVNRRELERRLDELVPLYASWGVAGMKYGFVNVGSQAWTTWLHEAIETAAQGRLMLDIHDEFRLTGEQRTWPHVMTVEGIRGNETMPEAAHNCALPFTRYICGPGDYTPCWNDTRLKTTRAHQLALAAVTYSPWQFLFWYDRPQAIEQGPELEFWRQIPTVWDDTRVLGGEIGQFATVARRSGDDWFVGTINAIEPRTRRISLAFLEPGRHYRAHIYGDAAIDGGDPTRVSCSTRAVTAADTIEAVMAHNGGHAVWLEPVP